MEEKNFVKVRKEEYNIRKFVKKMFGKGLISQIRIEYTPVGEKIVISTHRPGLIIGKKGEKIISLTSFLKKKFTMENPHVDIEEIKYPEFDAQLVADELALALERFGSSKYKSASYRALSKIKNKGAQGAELRITGKLPSDRARSWRFSYGYLKKTGDNAGVVDRAKSVAKTKKGIVGIKVAILAPGIKMKDQIEVNEKLLEDIKENIRVSEEPPEVTKKTKKKIKK